MGGESARQAEQADREAAAVSVKPAAVPLPAPLAATGAVATRLLALQRTAGNHAVTTMLQRQPLMSQAPPQPNQSVAPPATVDPQQQARMLRASTTLQRVAPLAEADARQLEQAIPGAPLMTFIRERDEKRRRLEERNRQLQAARDQQAHPPEHGLPPPREEVDRLAAEVDALTRDVEHLDRLVRAGLEPLGIGEGELVSLISTRFPQMFVQRARQIAIAELDSNRRIAEEEMHRYGLDACVDPVARQSLRAAAADLVARDRRIADLQRQMQTARGDDIPLPGGVPEPQHQSSSHQDVMRLQQDIEREGRERREAEARHKLRHPVLMKQPDLAAIAAGDDAAFDRTVGGELRRVVENIDATKENVNSGRLKVWNLRDVVATTKQDLGIEGNAVLEEAVQQHIDREQSDEAMVQMAIGALAITAGIIATVATAGSALAVGATVVAAGASAYTAAESVQNYLAESHAGNVALDPAVADISAREPELGWLILDLIGAGLDAVAVVQAVNALRRTARAVRETGELAEFAQAARSALPAHAADRVMASVGRRSEVTAAVGRQIRAIGTEFLTFDLHLIGQEIGRHADEGFRAFYDNLRRQGRIRPLNAETLRATLEPDQAERWIAQLENLNGLYPETTGGALYIKEGALQEVSVTAVHEVTHYLQREHGAGLLRFQSEFQAHLMEQRYIQRLYASAGNDVRVVPIEWRWMIDADGERIAREVLQNYRDAVRPADLEMGRHIEETLARLRAIR